MFLFLIFQIKTLLVEKENLDKLLIPNRSNKFKIFQL